MKNYVFKLVYLFTIGNLLVVACRQKDDLRDPSPGISDSEISASSTFTSDHEDVSGAIDEAINNINESLVNNIGGRISNELSCGYTVDYSGYSTVSGSNQKTIVFNYEGTSCANIKREGTITVRLISGNLFRDKDAVYNVNFEGYRTTKGGRTMTITGTHTVTNITGGLAKSVLLNPSAYPIVTHKITGNMQITFDTSKGGVRTWQLNRLVSWANTSGVLSMTVSGNENVDGFDNVSIWGTNRFGNKFYTQIIGPIIVTSSCGWYRPVSGERKHTLQDSDGNLFRTINAKVITGADGCGTGILVTATNKNGLTRTRTINY